MERSSLQKINKETVVLNGLMDQVYLIDIYRILNPQTAEYTFFLSAYSKCSKINHVLGAKEASKNLKGQKLYHAFFSQSQWYININQL